MAVIPEPDSRRETHEFAPVPASCHEVQIAQHPHAAPPPLLDGWSFCRPARPDPCGAGDPAWLAFLGVAVEPETFPDPVPDSVPDEA